MKRPENNSDSWLQQSSTVWHANTFKPSKKKKKRKVQLETPTVNPTGSFRATHGLWQFTPAQARERMIRSNLSAGWVVLKTLSRKKQTKKTTTIFQFPIVVYFWFTFKRHWEENLNQAKCEFVQFCCSGMRGWERFKQPLDHDNIYLKIYNNSSN